MLGRDLCKYWVSILALTIIWQICSAKGQDKNSPASNSYSPPANATPIQLKAYLEKMQKIAPAARQPGFGEAMVTASDKILSSNPSESLRSFAVLTLLDGLHQSADAENNADADKRLAELAAKYSTDSDKRIVATAKVYDLEERVLNPGALAPANIPKLLDEAKSELTGRTLTAAKYIRLATGIATLINYLGTDQEAEKQFKQFGHLFETSGDPALARFGTQLKSAKRDPKPVEATDKIAADNAQQHQPAATTETALQWIQRVESQLASLMGSEHDAEYESEKANFLKAYPQDPLRWNWNFMDVRRALSVQGNREQGIKTAKAAMAEVLAAHDAVPELREQASAISLQLDVLSHVPVADLAKSFAAHVKNYPKSTGNAGLAQMIVQIVAGSQVDAAAVARLQELKSSSDGLLAAAASDRLTQLQNLLELKTKPLELKFTDVDGHHFDLESYRGKVVLIDFWATWCGPCKEGLPEVIEQYKKYHDQGFEIVGISFDQDKQTLQQFVKDNQMGWIQFFDGKGWENTYGRKYGIASIPNMWLVGRDGKVIDFAARAGLPQKISKLMESTPGSSQATSNSAALPPNKS